MGDLYNDWVDAMVEEGYDATDLEPSCGLWWILSTVTTGIGLGIGLGALLWLVLGGRS